MEDVARFAITSESLCADCKSLRHALREIGESLAAHAPWLDPTARLAARDTPGDVGTSISTPLEARRENLASIVSAAGSRTTEALRVIEESAKLAGAGEAASKAEASRYLAYDLHRRIALALGASRGVQWKLCVLVTESLCTHHPWVVIVKKAIEGGADCFQLREKSLADSALLSRARELISIARPAGASVVINDRPDIALLAGADGVHVGQEDLPVAAVRRLAGASLLVGVSTTNLDQARAAALAGADMCGVGPMFETRTKHKPILAGPQYLSAYLADEGVSRIPHLAIGGIGPENVRTLGKLGCRGVAVSSGVCSAADPAEVCRSLRRELLCG